MTITAPRLPLGTEIRSTFYGSPDGSETILVTVRRTSTHREWLLESVATFEDNVMTGQHLGWDPIPDDLDPYVEHALRIARAEQ